MELAQSKANDNLVETPSALSSSLSWQSLFDREKEVLLGGLTDGLGRAARTTWSDLSDGARQFADHPFKATGQYLSDHWSEAAVGCLITAINPRGAANWALLAYSGRGLAVASWQAASMAADSQIETKEARNYYASAISHEGSAFLGSLPMTLAGGMIGRAGANAVFGKDMGAADLLTGKVTLSEVKKNLWNIHDNIRPPAIKLLVTDMDDTLLSTEKHNALGIQRGIAELSKKTGLSEDTLYQTIGQEMEKWHSRSYPWTMELALSDKLKVGKAGGMSYEQFRSQVTDPFWKVMDATLEDHLTLFDGVRPTFEQLKARGIPVVILSDASASAGLKRAVHLGLDQGLVERLYVLRNPKEPAGLDPVLLAHGRQRLEAALSAKHGFKDFGILPREWEKPRTGGLESLMQQYGVRPRQTLMVGDNLTRDMGVAADAGTSGLRFAGSKGKTPEFQAIFDRLKPEDARWVPRPPKITQRELDGRFQSITSYLQVLDYLNPRPNWAAIARDTGQSLMLPPPLKSAVQAFGLEKD